MPTDPTEGIIIILTKVWEGINTNFFASLIGGFLANIIFWKVIQEKLLDKLELRDKKRLSQAFVEELVYNQLIAEKKIAKPDNENHISLKYETEAITNFLSARPLELARAFYINIRVKVKFLKEDNSLMDLYLFRPKVTETERNDYRDKIIRRATDHIDSINNILSDENFNKQERELGILDLQSHNTDNNLKQETQNKNEPL